MQDPVIERRFEIAEDGRGNMLVLISAKPGEPSDPVLKYEGGTDAILERAPGQTVVLPRVHPEALPTLIKRRRVTVVEMTDGSAERSYDAKVRAAIGSQRRLPTTDGAPIVRDLQVEAVHDFVIAADGAVSLIISEKRGDPKDPVLRYAEGKAALYREGPDGAQVITLPDLHPDAPSRLKAVDEVTIFEVGQNDQARHYVARVEVTDGA